MKGKAITAAAQTYIYAIGIGSNRPLSTKLGPRAIVQASFAALDTAPVRLIARSSIIVTRPIGPSMRSYANAVALISCALPPLAMLDHLQAVERDFGRRRYRRWGARTLDLDLLLWSGGNVRSQRLTIPHPELSNRAFVLMPLRHVAARWRASSSGLTVAHLTARLLKPKPVDRNAPSL